MTTFNEKNGVPLGEGLLSPDGSVQDKDLSGNLRSYKARVAGSYRAALPEEITSEIKAGKYWVSPKVDGELWFLILGDGSPWLASPKGKVISGKIPLLEEATATASKAEGRTVVAGELFAAVKSGRPRVGDLKSAMGGQKKAEVERLGFSAFDLVQGGTDSSKMPLEDYGERLAVLQKLLEGGKRLKVIQTHEMSKPDEISGLFDELVNGGKAEGLVARSEKRIVYKLKPSISLDMVILGYTERTSDASQVRSILLGLMREDGQFQIISSCGNVGTDENRAMLMKKLKPECVEAELHFASGSGEVFHFVKPKTVAEIRVTDIQAENTSGDAIKSMVIQFSGIKWIPVTPMPSASLLHPVLLRQRDDKSVNSNDVRFSQLLERTHVDSTDQTIQLTELPKSNILERMVWTKDNKGQKAVQKLLVWKTGKETKDQHFPAYVVHWTDFSQVRKDPLKREVRLAPSEKIAKAIGKEMIETKIKKGWEELKFF